MMRPGTTAPDLSVKTVEGKTWILKEQRPEKKSLIVFYRGLHCPVCKTYLQVLADVLEDFKEQGVTEVIAVSGDSQKKAIEAKEKWNITGLQLGYEQSLISMTQWGLFISKSVKNDEPNYFGEPGLFLVDTENKLFYCATNSMPFARPPFRELLKGLQYADKENYPRRGTVAYEDVR